MTAKLLPHRREAATRSKGYSSGRARRNTLFAGFTSDFRPNGHYARSEVLGERIDVWHRRREWPQQLYVAPFSRERLASAAGHSSIVWEFTMNLLPVCRSKMMYLPGAVVANSRMRALARSSVGSDPCHITVSSASF